MRVRIRWLSILFYMLALSGCAGVHVNLRATSDVNPDIRGVPSPIVITLYALQSPELFDKASYWALMQDPSGTLGASLLSMRQQILVPRETYEITFPQTPDLHAVGVIAAYQEISNARWKASIVFHHLHQGGQKYLGESLKIIVGRSGLEILPGGVL